MACNGTTDGVQWVPALLSPQPATHSVQLPSLAGWFLKYKKGAGKRLKWFGAMLFIMPGH